MSDFQNRRAFLRTAAAATAAWATVDLIEVERALAWAGAQARENTPAPLSALTAQQGEALTALTSRIIPSVDGRPGAREAGVVFFIDRALSTFNAPAKTLYAEGIADLERRAGEVGSARHFAALTPEQQDSLVRQIEDSPFFQSVRFDTIVGTFALPTYGGNRDYVGWHMLGFEHQPRFQAPFGFYDAEINRRG